MEGMLPTEKPRFWRIKMATANSNYSFAITSDEVLAAHPKSGLPVIVVEGECTNPDGLSFNFIATNNLDQRYPDRFKVNWNGSKARMPEVVGHGIGDDVKGTRSVSQDLYFTRGARIAIAKKCRDLYPLARQTTMAMANLAEAVEAEVEATDEA